MDFEGTTGQWAGDGRPIADMAVIEAELVSRTPGLARLVEHHGPCTFRSRRAAVADHFEALAAAIVHQQLAGRAAAVIWARVRALAPGGFVAQDLVALEPAALRSAGLSAAKAAAVADLAQRVADGSLDLAQVAGLDDEDVVARLSQVRGIGRWTAQMFLIFSLGRLDVWPTGDLGVRRGYGVIHGLAETPGPVALETMGDIARPWRSVLAWYCWRALEGVPLDRVGGLPDLPTGR